MSRLCSLVSVTACLFLCGTAAAQSIAHKSRGWYAGGGFTSSNVAAVAYDYWYDEDYDSGDDDNGFVVHAGYRFNNFLAIEAGYHDAGKPEWNEYGVFLPEFRDVFDTDVVLDVTSFQASVLGVFPFARRWEMHMRGGASVWDIRSDQLLAPVVEGKAFTRTLDDTGTDFLFGFGVGFSPDSHLQVRVEFQTFFIEEELLALNNDYDASVDSIIAELIFRFGRGWERRR